MSLLRTPLYAVQKERGARFVPFAGYELPVQYAGVIEEHTAVRSRVGLFDVSHMGEIMIEGPGALDLLQWIITNDAAKLVDGKAIYTVMCVETGGVVDDLIVYREAADRYFLCVNASRRDADREHITAQARRFNCRVRDVSHDWAQLALQGPRADAVLAKLAGAEVAKLERFAWVDTVVAGVPEVRVARTGYTGERGFELYVKAAQAEKVWRALEDQGRVEGLALCGLGARDTLRLEMKYPLYGNDIDGEHDPLAAGLGFVVKLGKGDFLGKARLAAIHAEGPRTSWVGFKMVGRGIPRPGYPMTHNGQQVGLVTSGTYSPSLGEPIGCGYVPAALKGVGTSLAIVIRDKPVAAVVVATPFYRPANP